MGPRTILHAEEEAATEYTVMVMVTEAGGPQRLLLWSLMLVTITVKDVNEAPMVTGGVTTLKQAEDDADISIPMIWPC